MIENVQFTDVEYFEKMILSRAIQYPQQRNNLRLEPHHFFDDRHGAIFLKLSSDKSLTKEDLLTESVKNPKQYGNYDFIRSITEFPVSSEHGIVNDQMQVYQFYKERTINQMMQDHMQSPTDEKALEVSNAIQRLEQFDLKGNDNKLSTLSDIMDDLHGVNQQTITGTNFRELDNIISGFEKQQLNIVAARPSIGKTAFALELSRNLAETDANVVFCSLESTEKNMTQRLLSSMARVDLYKFKNPVDRMKAEEMEKVKAAMDIYNEMPLRIEEKAKFTPNMIRNIANNTEDDKPCFILIDYLQLMQSDVKHNSKYEEVSHISRELKMITQEMSNVTVISLAQLNRGVEARNDKRPMMSDLRDSGGIEQDASMIMMLYRDDYYNQPEHFDPTAPSDLDVIVTKNKDGGLGTATLEFYKQIQQIY